MFETCSERLVRSASIAIVASLGLAGISSANETSPPKIVHVQDSGTPEPLASASSISEYYSTSSAQRRDNIQNEIIPGIDIKSPIITKEAQDVMDMNAAYIPGLHNGCSGFIIRDPGSSAPIGVITAEHCDLVDDGSSISTPRLLGNDGKRYVVFVDPLKVEITGKDSRTMKTVGTIKEFYLPGSTDNTIDFAFGALAGNSIDKVMSVYNDNKLPVDQIMRLKMGTQAFMSGYPQAHLKDIKYQGVTERQEFPLIVLGVIKQWVNVGSMGKYEDILYTAVRANSNGAVCSYGASGGEGFIMLEGKPRSIGVLATFEDYTSEFGFTKDAIDSQRSTLEKQFGVDLSNVRTVCGFNFTTPDETNAGVSLEIANSYQEVPGYFDNLIATARKNFFDPTYVKNIFDASINIGQGKNKDWIYRPVVFNDHKSGGMIIACYSAKSKDGLKLTYVPNIASHPFFGNFTFGLTTTGLINILTKESGTSFIDQQGQIFGQEYGAKTPPHSSINDIFQYSG